MTPVGTIRRATEADMEVVAAWLPKDRSVGTLAMNWHITMKVFKDDGVWIWVDAVSEKPVAYCWGSLNSEDSILEVQPEYRGSGIGRALVAFLIDRSTAERDPLLEIHIAPDSAEPFWQEMGFETYWREDNCYGRRILELPQAEVRGVRRIVTVAYFPDSVLWSKEPNPMALSLHEVEGHEVPDGRIILDKIAAEFNPGNGVDLVIDVRVDGNLRYRGKAKHQGAQSVGVIACRQGFMIGEILPNDEL